MSVASIVPLRQTQAFFFLFGGHLHHNSGLIRDPDSGAEVVGHIGVGNILVFLSAFWTLLVAACSIVSSSKTLENQSEYSLLHPHSAVDCEQVLGILSVFRITMLQCGIHVT